jgi:hypothetical protein
VMVGSWLCKVSSVVHINGRRVNEPVREDKGKAMVPKSEDEKYPKRAHMVLSKGHEMVVPSYPMLLGDATRAMNRGEESGNPKWVGRVRWEYDMDRRIDRVSRYSQGNWKGYLGRWADRVTQDSWGN